MVYKDRDKFIKDNIPFIVKTIAGVTKRYVEVENSEELGIALEAFNDLLDTYDEEKGHFYSYAKVVIKNKLIDHIRKQARVTVVSIEEHHAIKDDLDDEAIVRQELIRYKEILNRHGISFELLASHKPVHKNTKDMVFELALMILRNTQMVQHLVEKKRLPMTKISKDYGVSIRFIKSHKYTITAIILAHEYKIQCVMDYFDYER
ncbi:sigma-70 family RNA polymerase sigma factor [Petrocella sp. FN5]|uniref:sigma-70 family RNA polymerase sigma factor n=1 Tax=Petrocella sp. FN5 TaxID=3032002 RepID=UPI0023DAAC6B|nr:sigma-70 family RNA polymerase sigma factor [Petrocella sp. FN5]MDF1617390.1 sigma-70 family RNA polymerase sigma factor [Petrocella sp. FN5]